MKKVRVDFSAHTSIVVQVKDSDDYLDRAAELANEYVNTGVIKQDWEVDDEGVFDAKDTDEVDYVEETD